jgi:hypothetical protein
MHSLKHFLIIAIFLVAIIAPFNNCAIVPTTADHIDQASARSNLNVQIENKGTVTFDRKTQTVMLRGSCNADSFQQNVVWWSIEANGRKIWDSYMAGGEAKLSRCTDKKFSVLVTAPCKSGVDCQMFSTNAGNAFVLRAHISGLSGEQMTKFEASSNALSLVR